MSIHSFFLKGADNTVKELKHKNSRNTSYANAKLVTDSYFDWKMIHLKIVQNYAKLFSCVYIDGTDYNAVICHGKIMSLYDMINFKWKSHILLEDEILYLFYIKWTNTFISTILANGQVHYYDFSKVTDGIPVYDKVCKLEGEMIRFNYDNNGLWPLFVTVKENDAYELKVITRHAAVQSMDIRSDNENLSAISFYLKPNFYVLIQDGKSIKVFEL